MSGRLTDKSVTRAQAHARVVHIDADIDKLKVKRANAVSKYGGNSPKVADIDAQLVAKRKDRQDAAREANGPRKSRRKGGGGGGMLDTIADALTGR